MMVDLDVIFLSVVGAAFLTTGGALLRGPAIERERTQSRRAAAGLREAEEVARRMVATMPVLESDKKRLQAELAEAQGELTTARQAVSELAAGREEVARAHEAQTKGEALMVALRSELLTERQLAAQLELQGEETRARLREAQEESRRWQTEASEAKVPRPASATTSSEVKVPDARPSGPKANEDRAAADLKALEAKLKLAEQRATGAEARLKAAETRATNAEAKTAPVETKLRTTEQRVADAEGKLRTAEQRALDAETKLREATQLREASETKLRTAETLLEQGETRLRAAEERAAMTVATAAEADEPDGSDESPGGPLEAAQQRIESLERMLEGSRARARDLQKELTELKASKSWD